MIQNYQNYLKEIEEKPTTKEIPQNWEDFVRLTTIRSGNKMVVFEPYEYQRIVARLMDKYSNMTIIKSRQLGITQLAASKFFHKSCLNAAHTGICFMRNDADASSISRRTKQMYSSLLEKGFIKKPEIENVGYLKLRGKGDIYFRNSSREGSRSLDSVSSFLFDECAFIHNIEQIYAASSPSGALVGDSICKLIVSTPSSKQGWYWQKLSENNGDRDIESICEAVAQGELFCDDLPGLYYFEDENHVLKLVLHWRCHPVYSQIENYLEYRQKADSTDLETVLREYDLKFVNSSRSIFSATLVNSCSVSDWEKNRDRKAKYYAGLDTCLYGDDYCCFPIIKELDNIYSVVAMYRERKQSNEYHLYHIAELIRKFKPDCIGVEVNSGGQIYYEQLSQEFPGIDIRAIHTTEQSKPALIGRLLLAMQRQILQFPNDKQITSEFLNYIREGNKLGASSNKHDDIVMGIAFGIAASPISTLPIIEDLPIDNDIMRLLTGDDE